MTLVTCGYAEPVPDPANLSDDDFRRIGEVVVHAAGLENMLIILASVLVWADRSSGGTELDDIRAEIQDNVLGQTSGPVLKTCRNHESVLYDVRTKQYLEDLWDDCEELFERRHAVAHSFWQKREDGSIEAQRPLPKWKRKDGFDFVTVGGTLDELAELRHQMDDAIADIKQLLDQAWPQEWPKAAAFTLRPPSRGRAERPRKRQI